MIRRLLFGAGVTLVAVVAMATNAWAAPSAFI